jgi:hypothetical protein
MNMSAPAPPFSGTMDVDELMAFLETRPHGEHWELIAKRTARIDRQRGCLPPGVSCHSPTVATGLL